MKTEGEGKQMKKINCVLLCIIILLSCNASILYARNINVEEIKKRFPVNGTFYVNKQEVRTEDNIIFSRLFDDYDDYSNPVYCPMRSVLEAIGAEVTWNAESEQIKVIYRDKIYICLLEGDGYYSDDILKGVPLGGAYLYTTPYFDIKMREVRQYEAGDAENGYIMLGLYASYERDPNIIYVPGEKLHYIPMKEGNARIINDRIYLEGTSCIMMLEYFGYTVEVNRGTREVFIDKSDTVQVGDYLKGFQQYYEEQEKKYKAETEQNRAD